MVKYIKMWLLRLYLRERLKRMRKINDICLWEGGGEVRRLMANVINFPHFFNPSRNTKTKCVFRYVAPLPCGICVRVSHIWFKLYLQFICKYFLWNPLLWMCTGLFTNGVITFGGYPDHLPPPCHHIIFWLPPPFVSVNGEKNLPATKQHTLRPWWLSLQFRCSFYV